MKEWNWLSEELDRLREQELYRTMTVLEGPQTTVVESAGRPQRLFSSNNYLDLANDPEVKAAACEALEQYGVGAGGSRLTTGTGPLHVRLEGELADLDDPRIQEVRIMGGCACIEVKNSRDVEGFQEFARRRGLFSRPFLRYIYSMVPSVITEEELVQVTDTMKAWFRR